MNILGNIGLTELIVIFLLALLVLGPERLPELSRKLGTLVRDLRQMYVNLSRDLGPELSSLPDTVKQVRDSAHALRTLPRDAILAISQAATLEEEARELRSSLAPGTSESGAVGSPPGQREALPAPPSILAAEEAPAEPRDRPIDGAAGPQEHPVGAGVAGQVEGSNTEEAICD